MGRQVVGDAVPAGHAGDEYVTHRLDAGVIVEAAQGNHRHVAFGVEARHEGAADLAKHLREVPRIGDLVGLEAVLALDEADTVVRREPIAGVGRSPAVTAARAVTVVGSLERFGDMVFDGAAQAAAANHARRLPIWAAETLKPRVSVCAGELRALLSSMGMSAEGGKYELVGRLQDVLEQRQPRATATPMYDGEDIGDDARHDAARYGQQAQGPRRQQQQSPVKC